MMARLSRDPANLAKLIDRRVAGRVRARRLGIGMTQQTLAESIGVAFQQVHKYETGISRITVGRLSDIADALRVPITYFFAIDGERERMHREAGNDD
ncbi:MAG TPA: helix-turn-helix transcriptional regulator [Stellaceae bacterium]|nr:helix-turn-helix transcriptional regulator [Stellaceae bacterium]